MTMYVCVCVCVAVGRVSLAPQGQWRCVCDEWCCGGSSSSSGGGVALLLLLLLPRSLTTFAQIASCLYSLSPWPGLSKGLARVKHRGHTLDLVAIVT